MFDPTKLPTKPCDPASLEAEEKVAPAPAPEYARAPDGDGHAAALRSRGGAQ